MPINQTFDDLLKSKITTDLASYILDRTVVLTNDINLYAQRKDLVGNEVYGVVVTSTGDRIGGDIGSAITKSVLIEFAVPIDYREDFLEYISDYVIDENQADTQSLTSYYFKANYQTPTCDGMVFNINGKNYVKVSIGGYIYYGDFALVEDVVTIAGTTLSNIIGGSKSATPNNEVLDIAGLSSQVIITHSISDIKTYRVLYVGTNTLHATLRGYLNNPSTLPTSVSVSVNSQSYTAKMTLSEELVNGFVTITITLQRTGAYA